MSDKPKRMTVTKSPEILASETLIAVTTSETVDEAAEKLGISRQQVYKRIDKYELKEKIVALKENAILEISMGATKAARKLNALVDSEDNKIALGASNSVLDRVGITKGDSNNTNIFMGDVQFINAVPRPGKNEQS
jgi:predicted DNA-binding protein (UPF0251 family)